MSTGDAGSGFEACQPRLASGYSRLRPEPFRSALTTRSAKGPPIANALSASVLATGQARGLRVSLARGPVPHRCPQDARAAGASLAHGQLRPLGLPPVPPRPPPPESRRALASAGQSLPADQRL